MSTQAASKLGHVVTFGEAMIRLTPPRNERLERTMSLDLSPGGAELNVAATLACLQVPVSWVSVLPDNGLARFITRQARAANVDLSHLVWVPESYGRTGLYFLEEGTDPRPSAVTYDRANSAMANMKPGMIDWAAVFDGAAAFHISGITPAVSPACRAETVIAMKAANTANVPVFFDLNYRSKLWSEADARACFVEIIQYVDVLFAGKGNLKQFYGLDAEADDILDLARTKLGVRVAVGTMKKAKASRSIKLNAMAVGPSGELVRGDWKSVEIVDRLGGGDSFAGGFIAGYLEDQDNLELAVKLGVAAQALKHTQVGDFLSATRAEIETAMMEDLSGVLQR